MSARQLSVAWTSWVPFSDDAALEAGLVELVDRVAAGTLLPVVGVLLAAAIGALHALGPGHGKVLISAYLLGGRGQARDAVALGVLVAAMHTVSVLVVASILAATQEAGTSVVAETVTRLIAATGVTVLGVVMVTRELARRRRGRLPAGTRSHAHDHDHAAPGSEALEHAHSHLPPREVPPLSRAGIAAVASTGGLLPSPAAVVVLLTLLALGRPLLGVVLVLAFGLGLATTLAGLGLLVLSGRTAVDRATAGGRLQRLRAGLPLISGVAITAGGLLLLGVVLTA